MSVSAQVTPRRLRVATYNIHGAIGRDGRRDPVRIARVLAEMDADCIALQEVPLPPSGVVTRDGSRGATLDALLGALPGWHCVSASTVVVASQDFGNVVLSRHPLRLTRTHDLSFRRREPRAALEVEMLLPRHRPHAGFVAGQATAELATHDNPAIGGVAWRIVATHFGLRHGERRFQTRQILQSTAQEVQPTLLLGDFNEWSRWGATVRLLAKHFQALPARRTFPSGRPLLALDRIWVRPHCVAERVVAHRSTLSEVASDHLPLVADLRVT